VQAHDEELRTQGPWAAEHEKSPERRSWLSSFAVFPRQSRCGLSDGHVVQIIKKGHKVAGRSPAQSSFPSNKHASQLGAQIRPFINLPVQISEFLLEEISDYATWGASRAIHPKDFGQLMQRETRALGGSQPLEVLDFSRSPEAVPGGRSLRLRHEDCLWGNPIRQSKVDRAS
jgi:hypothetical protein